MNINHICMSCMTELNEEGVCLNCQTTNASNRNDNRHLPVRTILRGKYLVGRVIGEGGFGITYIGYDLDLQFPVAIKEFCPREFAGREMTDHLTLLPFDANSEEIFEAEKEKFINEARRLARFRNEQGVVSVLDYFKENGTAYIVMDFIEGTTLRKYLNMLNAHMQMEELLKLLKPLMETLEKIHGENMVHRDISPDNIMISRDRKKVYLIDFGTARDVNTGNTLSVYKKGAYTPLEQQSRDGRQGSWTDVYALCATIYFCITGRNIPEAVDRIIEDKLVAPSKLGVNISPAMEAALLKGLEVRVENRVQTIGELIQAFYPADKSVVKEEDTAAAVVKASKEQKNVPGNDITVPVDQNGNVDIEALPVSDAERYEAKRIKEELAKVNKKISFIGLMLLWGVIMCVMLGMGWILVEMSRKGIIVVENEIIAGIIGVIPCTLGIFLSNKLLVEKIEDSIWRKSKIEEKIFPNKCNRTSIVLHTSIQKDFTEAKISYTLKNFNTNYVRKDAPNKFMDYYYKTILPDNSISQELKDAWVYQTKKSGNWK